MARTPNKSQQTKLTLEKKILPPLLPGFELATFRSRVRRFNQQVIPAPPSYSNEETDLFAHNTFVNSKPVWGGGGEGGEKEIKKRCK